MALEQLELAAPRIVPSRRRSRRSAPATPTRAPRTRSASPTWTSCAASAATSSTRPTSSRARARSASSRRCSSGARPSASRRSPSAAAPRSSAASPPTSAAGYNGAVSLDLGALDRVLEVDEVSRAARIQAGALGPALEAQLREHGLTLRHFPQSFEFSTLGGWIATRAGGPLRDASGRTSRTSLESVRAITPVGRVGVAAAARLRRRASAPTGMLAGSEGTLGVITEAWVRVQPRPSHRSARGRALRRASSRGAECVRAISQSGLHPSNCRLLDAGEAGADDGRATAPTRCSCSASSRPTTPSRRR